MPSAKRTDKKGRIFLKGEGQEKSGRYYYRYVDMYGNRRKVYSWKLEESDVVPSSVKEKEIIPLRQLEEKIITAKVKKIDIFTAENTTLNERWDIYFKTLEDDIKPSTKSNYIYSWNKYVRDRIGQNFIADIKTSSVLDYYGDVRRENGLKYSTIRGIINLISATLDLCVDDGLLDKNHAESALKRLSKNNKAKKKKEEREILTPEQETAFLEFLYTDKRCEKWKNLFVILLATGMRVSELCGLTKEDIDFKKGAIQIRRNLMYRKMGDKCRLYVSSTKTVSSERDFPIYCDKLKNALKDELEKHTDNGEEVDGVSGWVFRNRYGIKPMTENNCNDGLRRILSYYNETITSKKLKIKKISCQNFRHTFATKCEIKGMGEIMKKNLLGHSTRKDITAEYTHLKFDYISKEAKRIFGNEI